VFGANFLFTAAQIIPSNSVKEAGKGLRVVDRYHLDVWPQLGLGFAGTVEMYTNDSGKSPVWNTKYVVLGHWNTGSPLFLALGFVHIL